jgi:hypothetical protein
VLCDYIIKEVENVFLEKFPHRVNEMKTFNGRQEIIQEGAQGPVQHVEGVPLGR